MNKDSRMEEESRKVPDTISREKLLEVHEELAGPPSEKPQLRMRKVMSEAARVNGLRWSAGVPSGHPYHARLDGALFQNGKPIAVVELAANDRKQAVSALVDLLVHPTPKRILVIGRTRSKKTHSAMKVKKEIVEDVLPALRQLMARPPDVGVFTEAELRLTPKLLGEYLGLPVS